MADYTLFKKCATYKQIKGGCLLVSYGTIIEYYTNRRKPVNNILNIYRKNFIGVLPFYKKIQEALEQAIKDHIHDYCRPLNMRGLTFIEQIHNNNDLGTYDDCEIVDWEAPTPPRPITANKIVQIKDELETKNSLAMVVYEGVEEMHTVVIGYDSKNGSYFCGDPNDAKAKIFDIISTYDIYEYILFSDFDDDDDI